MEQDSNKEFGKLTLEEIWQIPQMLSRTLKFKKEINEAAEFIVNKNIKDIHLTGDGTSYHAGFSCSYVFNNFAKIKTISQVSPEFGYLYGEVLDPEEDMVIGISQSGESEMTLEAMKIAQKHNIPTLSITNTEDSSIGKISDQTLLMRSGVEKSVLATKTYVNTLGILSRLAIEVAYLKRNLNEEAYSTVIDDLKSIPKAIEYALPQIRKQIRTVSPYFKFAQFCFVLGSGPDYGTALEASLKLKEGARVFSQAYSTAEFPHGPITLADESSWILAIIPSEEGARRDIILKLLRKVKERSATVTGVFATDILDEELDLGFHVPRVNEYFQPFLSIVPIQLLSAELAIQKGINPDKPKYLSKVSSV